jgi:DNA-binding NarL/FixJ family response regulator
MAHDRRPSAKAVGPHVAREDAIYPYSILLVDSSDVVRLGCKMLFEADHRFEIAGDLRHVNDPQRSGTQIRPDLVVFDPLVEGDFDANVIPAIIAGFPGASYLIFTDYTDCDFMVEAFYTGIRGFIVKYRTPGELLLAGAYVVASKMGLVADRLLVERAIENVPNKPPFELLSEASLHSLTSREREILHLLARGFSDDEVAHQLGLARTTVYSHVSSMLRKVPVSNRVQLGVYALQAGFIRGVLE